MMQSGLPRLNTIRGRLWIGFGVLVGLLVMAGLEARRTFSVMSGEIAASLSEVEAEATLTSQVSGDVAKTIEAASHYLETRDSSALTAFRAFGFAAHEVQRQMSNRPGQTASEVATLATIDAKLSEMEIRYALAHRLADLGRMDEARSVAATARHSIDELLSDIALLGRIKADRVAAARTDLTAETSRRSELLISIIGLALVFGI